jgi:ribosome modulation factor
MPVTVKSRSAHPLRSSGYQMTGDMTMTYTQAELVQRKYYYMDGCWLSGYRAYEARIARAKCPLAKGSEARKAWEDGWDKARHEYEDEPPAD